VSISYLEFREKNQPIFDNVENTDSVSYQLIDLTDLFQKISAIYAFASEHAETSFQNPIIFQIVESALQYGVCVQIRRLADGSQRNEISLYKLINEIRSNCHNWDRQAFVTWDGSPYDATELRRQSEMETSRLIQESIKDGTFAAWTPRGEHEEIERRHSVFDLLSSKPRDVQRSPHDLWDLRFSKDLEQLLANGSKNVTDFANKYLAHRIHFSPESKPSFSVPLQTIEFSICALWKCFNVLNSVFHDSYMSPEIIHQHESFLKLDVPLVNASFGKSFAASYEKIKLRIESDVNQFARGWEQHFLDQR
jgi:hypothetical protein